MSDAGPLESLRAKVRDVPNFPKPGIVFKDITPLLQDPRSLRTTCDLLAAPFRGEPIDLVVGIESRGFLFGPTLALALDVGFAPARKRGKLPWRTLSESYALEYGSAELELHRDAVVQGCRVLLVDDVIATGGTAAASARLVRALGGVVVAAAFVIELSVLDGRRALEGLRVESLLRY